MMMTAEQAAELQRRYLALDRSSGLVTQEMLDWLDDFDKLNGGSVTRLMKLMDGSSRDAR